MNNNKEEGNELKVIVPYEYGNYNYRVCHIDCAIQAKLYGEKVIKILEKQRLGKQNV